LSWLTMASPPPGRPVNATSLRQPCGWARERRARMAPVTQDSAMAHARPDLAGIRSGDLRRDYATTFLTEVMVIAAWLVAFRLVAVHFGQSGFGEYALSRRTLSLISPLAVVGV